MSSVLATFDHHVLLGQNKEGEWLVGLFRSYIQQRWGFNLSASLEDDAIKRLLKLVDDSDAEPIIYQYITGPTDKPELKLRLFIHLCSTATVEQGARGVRFVPAENASSYPLDSQWFAQRYFSPMIQQFIREVSEKELPDTDARAVLAAHGGR